MKGTGETVEFRESASIPFDRGDAFLHNADVWLKSKQGQCVAAIAVDLNYFLLYNSVHGWSAGNRLLMLLSDSIGALAKGHGGLAGYLGDDDFCLFIDMAGTDQDSLKEEVQRSLDRDFKTPGFSPAYGVYIANYRGESASKLYESALEALSSVRGRYTEHISVMDEERLSQIQQAKRLARNLGEALEEHEFIFDLQPCIDYSTQRVFSAEALIRWKKDGHIVGPGIFLKPLEKNGHIYALDHYLWEEVFKMQKDILGRGRKPVPVSVNLSQMDFYFGDIAGQFIGLSEKYGLDSSLIKIEIPERVCVDAFPYVSEFITRVREKGFSIIIDDFGRGRFSDSFIQDLKVDTVKLDRAFIEHVNDDNESRSIIIDALAMAERLNIRAMAKGVETKEQERVLSELGCRYMQGFRYFRLMLVEEFMAMKA